MLMSSLGCVKSGGAQSQVTRENELVPSKTGRLSLLWNPQRNLLSSSSFHSLSLSKTSTHLHFRPRIESPQSSVNLHAMTSLDQWTPLSIVVTVSAVSILTGIVCSFLSSYFFPSDINNESELDNWESR